MLTASGATIENEIDVAVETPQADASFYGLMTLLGTALMALVFLSASSGHDDAAGERQAKDDWKDD